MKKSRSRIGLFRRLRLRLRPAFLVTFTLGGLAAVAGLAVMLNWIVTQDVRAEQLRGAKQSAELIARTGYAQRLEHQSGPLSASTLRALDETTAAAQRSGSLHELIVLNRKGRVLYSPDHRQIGDRIRLTSMLGAALDGQTVTSLQDATDKATGSHGRRLAVTVPLIPARRTQPVAAVQMRLPYEPVAASIKKQSIRLQLVLIGAALLFYAAMLPRLMAASRAARENFDPAMEILMLELGLALEADDLELHYQPIVELASGRVSAMESFLRWKHPRLGPLPPNEYLAAAARTDLIGPLTLYIIDRALRDCRAWRERGIDAGVHVNLSEANVLDERLPDEVGRLLGQWRVPSNMLCLEVTEEAIAADPKHAADILAGLDEMGVLISIDDFGTGYSSLAGLRDLPVGELKIDRTFISGLMGVDRDAAITRSVIGLAQDLDVRVIAEGVEDAATLQRLLDLGCDGAQGYYFAPALPLPELLAWLSAPTLRSAKADDDVDVAQDADVDGLVTA
jgi:EAL domain-containing protein (putative c-di-GMP-specific phosphodiesterase class I)